MTSLIDDKIDLLHKSLRDPAAKALKRARKERWVSQIKTKADLRAIAEGCWYDAHAAQRVINFFTQVLRIKHPVDPKRTTPFIPLAWQQHDVLEPIFGWKRADGLRRFSSAQVWIPKKNGKSILSSGITLYMLLADNEPEPEIYSAATTREQASIVYREVRKMIDKSPTLQRALTCRDHLKLISCPRNAGFYKVLSKDADASDGINAHGVIFDELHRQKNRSLWDTLLYASEARRQPLHVTISTAGDRLESIGFEQFKLAQDVQNDKSSITHTFAYVRAASSDDDWTDPKVWRKANPSLGATLTMDNMARSCESAKENPASLANFLRLRLNVWVGRHAGYVDLNAWQKITNPVDPEALKGKTCHGGLDLSSNTDITAFVLKFKEGDTRRFLCWCWLPEDNLADREKRDGVPYRQWVNDGFLELTPGDYIDHGFIRKRINELAEQYHIEQIAYDPAFGTQIAVDLEQDGHEVFCFWQRATMFTPVLAEMDRLIRAGEFHHGQNPMLAWAANNLEVQIDSAGFMRPIKPKNAMRIDPIVSALMALGPDLKPEEEPPADVELLILD